MVLPDLSFFIKQKLVTCVLLMLFVAQSVLPSAMACQMMAQSSMPMMMDHGQMDHAMDTMAEEDCCQQDCSCPPGSCSAIFLVTSSVTQDSQSSSQKILLLPAKLIVQAPNLPFRPPIFA